MKATIFLFLLTFILIACEDNELEDNQILYDQLAGEWNITQITFPANDSTISVNGQALFTACEAQNNGCSGYFDIYGEVVNFTYQAHPFFDATSQITIGQAEGEEDNVLNLKTSTFNILGVDENNLIIDLAFCAGDVSLDCEIIHRHIIMTR